MKRIISEYRNIPGEHCGSAAMRSLLNFYCGVELPEEAIFGLGSGVDCMYLASEKADPPIFVSGRSVTMEKDVADALAVDYRESMEMDNDKAWEIVRREVEEGRPTMLTGDVFYLDFRKFKVHFVGHRFVLVGFDDEAEIAYVADRVSEEPQACSYGAIARSRNPPAGLSPYNLWSKFHDRKLKRPLEEACEVALRRSAERMLGRDRSQSELLQYGLSGPDTTIVTGLAGLDALSRRIVDWPAREDAAFLASYVSQSIEKFGTGGGNFRKMFAGFLRWAGGLRPDLVPGRLPALADESSARWTALSGTLRKASETPAEADLWKRASSQVRGILEVETPLFEELGAAAAR